MLAEGRSEKKWSRAAAQEPLGQQLQVSGPLQMETENVLDKLDQVEILVPDEMFHRETDFVGEEKRQELMDEPVAEDPLAEDPFAEDPIEGAPLADVGSLADASKQCTPTKPSIDSAVPGADDAAIGSEAAEPIDLAWVSSSEAVTHARAEAAAYAESGDQHLMLPPELSPKKVAQVHQNRAYGMQHTPPNEPPGGHKVELQPSLGGRLTEEEESMVDLLNLVKICETEELRINAILSHVASGGALATRPMALVTRLIQGGSLPHHEGINRTLPLLTKHLWALAAASPPANMERPEHRRPAVDAATSNETPTPSARTAQTPATDVARKQRDGRGDQHSSPSQPRVRRELQLHLTDDRAVAVKSARVCSLLRAFDVQPPITLEGDERRRQALAKVHSFGNALPQRQHKKVFGKSAPPKLQGDPQGAAQQRFEEILERQQMLIDIIEKRQEIADRRLAEVRSMRQHVMRLRMAAQQGHYLRAQWGHHQALAMHRQQIEQVHARQQQQTTIARIAQRQKEQLRAATESQVKNYRQQIREAERTKKRAEATMEAFFDLEKRKLQLEKAKLEQNELAEFHAMEDIKRIEAMQRLRELDEDVCPPAWDSSTGWIEISIAKHYTFNLAFPDGKFGTEKLERRVKATGISCLRRERHWKFGSFRVVYLLKLASKRRVAKSFILPRGKEMDWQDAMATARQYCLAKEFASRFEKSVKEKQPESSLKMKYVTSDVLELSSGEYLSTEECLGRDFNESDGDFVKWNNNADWFLDEEGEVDPYPQALSHFSFTESKHVYLLTDVQGWRPKTCQYILTDPALHTNDRQPGLKRIPGNSDHGYKGMQNFFAAHRCNAICKLLGLDKDHTPKPQTAVPR